MKAAEFMNPRKQLKGGTENKVNPSRVDPHGLTSLNRPSSYVPAPNSTFEFL